MRKPAVNIAVQAARRAGTVIQRSIHRADAIGVSDKGQYDFVTDADKLAEAEIIKEIRKAYPDHAIWGEETGRSGHSRYVWVIDPIDGTSNFMRGFPHCAVSIAMMEDGVIQHGVIYDPVRDEIFHATKGSGAYLNDRRIRIGARNGMPGALVATGFPFKQRHRLALQMRMAKALLDDGSDLRLKENVRPLENATAALGQLRGVHFDWRSGGRSVGLIAQEVEAVLPDAVAVGPDGWKGINPTGVIALLVEAVKEQQTMIDELRAALPAHS